VHGAGHGQHGARQGISHLILHDLRCLARERGLDDDLHVGQIRDRVERRVAHRVDAPADREQGHQQHQRTVDGGPANQAGDHGCLKIHNKKNLTGLTGFLVSEKFLIL